MVEKNTTNQSSKIGTLEKIAYGGGDLASNLILVLASTYVTYFYTNSIGVSAAAVGTIMMFSRFADGFTDIFVGYIMDKTKSKHGKARPWLLWLAIPIALSLVLIFLIPSMGTVGTYIYIIITYNLVTTFLYTMINIPYGALTALLSRDQDERMVINTFRMFMAQMGALVINAFTLPLLNAVGGSSEQRSWIIVSSIYGLIAAILFLICFAKTKERVVIQSSNSNKLPFGVAFKSLMRNTYWFILLLVWVFMIFGASLSGVVGIYYSNYILGNENLAGFITAISIAPAFVVIPLTIPVVRKIGKRNVAMIGSIVAIFGHLLIFINPTSGSWILFCTFIKGIGSAGGMATMFAMIADTIEYGHWKTGTRVEGMTYSSTTFGAKVGGGIGAAVALFILGSQGFDGMIAVQPESALDAIRFLYLVAPLPFLIIVPILYSFYKLDKIYPQVISELNGK